MLRVTGYALRVNGGLVAIFHLILDDILNGLKVPIIVVTCDLLLVTRYFSLVTRHCLLVTRYL